LLSAGIGRKVQRRLLDVLLATRAQMWTEYDEGPINISALTARIACMNIIKARGKNWFGDMAVVVTILRVGLHDGYSVQHDSKPAHSNWSSAHSVTLAA
jgi:hypothetical protein